MSDKQSIFISYSHNPSDRAFVEQLSNDLIQKGFNVWFDGEIAGGEKWENAIFRALKAATHVLIPISDRTSSSAWVRGELNQALESNKSVIPILLDGAEVSLEEMPELHGLPTIDGREDEEQIASEVSQVISNTPLNSTPSHGG